MLSASDDTNLRVWKALASRPLKALLPREKRKLECAPRTRRRRGRRAPHICTTVTCASPRRGCVSSRLLTSTALTRFLTRRTTTARSLARYSDALKARHAHAPDVRRIAKFHRVPAMVKKLGQRVDAKRDKERRKDANRRAHTRPENAPARIGARDRVVVQDQS